MCVLNTIYKQHGSATDIDIARECLKQGDKALAKEDYRQAIKFYREAETFIQTYEEGFNRLMETWINLDMYAEAEKHIEQALKRFPEYASAYNYKALIHACKEEWEAAANCFDKVIELRPETESAYVGKSEILFKQGKYDQARELVSRLLKMYPESEKANFQAAKAFFGLKEYDKAIKLFGKVAQLNPGNSSANKAEEESLFMFTKTESNSLKKALILLDNNKFKEALPFFESLVSESEPSAELHFYIGKAHKGLGNMDDAMRSFKKSLELEPESSEPPLEIADILFNSGREEEAMEYYEKILAADASNRQANIQKGNYLRKMGYLSEAEACYDTILASEEKDAEVYLLKGIVAIEKYPIAGNPLMFIDKAMELNPDYDLAMYYKGRFQLSAGQKKSYALESFNKAAYLASVSGNMELLQRCREAIAGLKIRD